MTIKQRKTRNDSTTAQIEMAQSTTLTTQSNLTEAQYLSAILKSKPTAQWSPNDLNIAKSLSKLMKYFEQLQSQLFEQGGTIINRQGNIVLNPLQNAVTQTATAIGKLTSTIGLTASQRPTRKGDVHEQWQVEAKVKGWNRMDEPTEQLETEPDWSAMAKQLGGK